MKLENRFSRSLNKSGITYASFTYDGIHYEKEYIYKKRSDRFKKFLLMHIKLIALLVFILSISALSYLLIIININSKYKTPPTQDIISPLKINEVMIYDINPVKLRNYLQNYVYKDIQDDYGWTPLHWAAFLKNENFISLLLAAGANPNIKSIKPWGFFPAGSTPKDIALLRDFHSKLL